MVWGKICASGKTPLVFVEEGSEINEKVYQRENLKLLYFRGTKGISEMQIGRFNKTLYQFAKPKRHKSNARSILQTYDLKNDHLLTGSQSHKLQCVVHFKVQGLL
ncbi:hypothetical protein TNCV_129801 [Trichonephila clavipes]|nr:hypothetical protein TNCV_129801 [Trichonephila clavipes]